MLEKIETLMQNITYNSELSITEKTKFAEIMEWDDLDTVELTMSLEQEYDIEFTEEEFEEITTIENLIQIIEEKLK
jgi:acyl carrier protein